MDEFEYRLRNFFGDVTLNFHLPELFNSLDSNSMLPCIIIISDDNYTIYENNKIQDNEYTLEELDELEEFIINMLIDLKPKNKPWIFIDVKFCTYPELAIQLILMLNDLNIGYKEFFGKLQNLNEI